MPPAGDDRRLPVDLLTGFLGSGKTTLLRRILRSPDFADAAVLINEFGEIGLDHLLVGALDEAPVLLPSGCICCTLRGDLARALRDLHSRRQRGEIPPFRRVVVETTGLADPAPLLATVAADLVVRHHFRPGHVVATVDALHAEAGLDAHAEIARQVAMADCLVVTKTDLAPAASVARLRELLHRLNPSAAVVEAAFGEVESGFLRQSFRDDPEARLAEAERWAADAPVAARRHGGIASFSIRIDGPLDWSLFGVWFSLLVHRHGARLLRVKGILEVAGSDTPVAVHAVRHVVHAPEHLPAWPTPGRGSCLVFITDGLEEDAVRRSLRGFMRLADPACVAARAERLGLQQVMRRGSAG